MAEPMTPLQVLQLFRPHDLTLPDFFASRVESEPEREMLVGAGESLSRSMVQGAALRLAARLADEGLGAGDRLVLVACNSPGHVIALLACGFLGAIFVPVNPQFNSSEMAYVLGHAKPRIVLFSQNLEVILSTALAEAGESARLLPLAPALWQGGGALRRFAPRRPEEPLLMIYTSGTTGFPKGALHSHQSFILAGEAFVGRLHLQPADRMLLILPMFHINALFYSVAGAFAAAAVLVVEERFSASKFWDVAVRHRITQVNMIEAVVSILLSRPESEYRPEHLIRKAYGIRQAMAQRVSERFGITHPIGGYGMTEIPGVISTPYGETAPQGSMGQICSHPDPARPWAKTRIVDDEGRDLPLGETGELWVATPVRMLGYFDDPEQTEAAFEDGWFRTGDLVRQDAAGNFYFVARKKDIIRVRGENVSGAEVDRILLSHPDVVVAAAIGVPSEMGDEDILAVVKLRDGTETGPEDLRAHCAAQMSAIKVPRYVLPVEALPLTPTHKVQKLLLRKEMIERRAWESCA